jgi:hypothetical protein
VSGVVERGTPLRMVSYATSMPSASLSVIAAFSGRMTAPSFAATAPGGNPRRTTRSERGFDQPPTMPSPATARTRT